MNTYFEVEWVDEDGSGHSVEFNKDAKPAMEIFVDAISPISKMVNIYEVTKQRIQS